MLSPGRGRSIFVVAGLFLAVAGFAIADDTAPPAPSTATGTIRGVLTIDGKTEHRKFKLEDSVLSLQGAELAKLSPPVPNEPATMDQNGIAYIPTVLVIRAGQAVAFKNSDPTLHNVHCQCMQNKPFNLAMNQNDSSKVVFEKPEIATITCNIHAAMKAFVVVLDNAFFAKAAPNGDFKIENVPVGEWSLKGWHDGTTPTVEKVTVKAGEETVVKINLVTKKR